MKRILLLFFLMSLFVSALVAQSPKRGMAYGYHSKEDLEAVAPGVSWWYNWSPYPDAGIADYYSSIGVEFVPMLWNNNYNVNDIIANIKPGTKYILAFNEPNFTVEANMTPAQAAAAWPMIEQIAAAKNLQIISAAAAYCGGDVCIPGYTDPVKWHDDFFAACPTCKVDYIAFHNYEPTVPGLTYLVGTLKKYNLPIWVTEFAYWDPAVSAADKIPYLQAAVTAFENDPDVYRYSWFVGRSPSNPSISILGANGTLTNLGSAYINAAYGPKHSIPGKIEAEELYRRKGTQLENSSDAGLGQNVGYTEPGTWNEFIVNVNTTGSYSMTFRVASNVSTGSFNILVDDQLVKSNVTVASTGGWQNWQDLVVNGIVLPQGEHLLKLEFTGPGTNINYFTTLFETTVAPVADFSASIVETCAGNPVVFTDISKNKVGGETYFWNFGAGASPATATTSGPHQVTYSSNGQKTVSLQVTNVNGTDTKTSTNYITITSPPAGCLFSDDFTNNTVNWIAPIPGAFTHTESGTDWRISNSGYGEWENFTYSLNNGAALSPISFQCASNKPIVKITAKASANCLLRLTLVDGNGRSIDNFDAVNLELTTSYQTFTIDFTGKFRNYHSSNPGVVDSTTITSFQFSINPGFHSYPYAGTNGNYSSYFPGTVDIDWIGIGANCNASVIPVEDIDGPATVDVNTSYTFSVPGTGVFTWTVPSGATILSGQGTNTITVTFTAGANGTISVTNGSSNSSMNVTVNNVTAISSFNSLSYSLSPNPFQEETILQLNTSVNSIVYLRVIDMHGVVVHSSESYTSDKSMHLGKELPTGVYTVIVYYDDTFTTFKINKIK